MKLAVIPARGGSQRIPQKNIKEFYGKPIICWSIETAEISGLFDVIAVSTDDPEIAKIAKGHNAVVVDRPAELASDDVGTQAVAKHAVEYLTRGGSAFEFVCVIYATAPLMLPEDLRRGLQLLQSSRAMQYAFSVGTSPLRDAAQFYWARTYALLDEAPLVAERSIMIPIDESRVIDINTPADWTKAEQMYAALT